MTFQACGTFRLSSAGVSHGLSRPEPPTGCAQADRLQAEWLLLF